MKKQTRISTVSRRGTTITSGKSPERARLTPTVDELVELTEFHARKVFYDDLTPEEDREDNKRTTHRGRLKELHGLIGAEAYGDALHRACSEVCWSLGFPRENFEIDPDVWFGTE